MLAGRIYRMHRHRSKRSEDAAGDGGIASARLMRLSAPNVGSDETDLQKASFLGAIAALR